MTRSIDFRSGLAVLALAACITLPISAAAQSPNPALLEDGKWHFGAALYAYLQSRT